VFTWLHVTWHISVSNQSWSNYYHLTLSLFTCRNRLGKINATQCAVGLLNCRDVAKSHSGKSKSSDSEIVKSKSIGHKFKSSSSPSPQVSLSFDLPPKKRQNLSAPYHLTTSTEKCILTWKVGNILKIKFKSGGVKSKSKSKSKSIGRKSKSLKTGLESDLSPSPGLEYYISDLRLHMERGTRISLWDWCPYLSRVSWPKFEEIYTDLM